MPHIPKPGFGLSNCCSRLASTFGSSQMSPTQWCFEQPRAPLPPFGHIVTLAEMCSPTSTDIPIFRPPCKLWFQCYFLWKSFLIRASHRGLTALKPHWTCCLPHVEFSRLSFCLITCLFFTLAFSFHISSGYGLFSQLSCKNVGLCVNSSGFGTWFKISFCCSGYSVWLETQSRWSVTIIWMTATVFYTTWLEQKNSTCSFCKNFPNFLELTAALI